jgi:hypothetical protein
MGGRRVALTLDVDVTMSIKVRKRYNVRLIMSCASGT